MSESARFASLPRVLTDIWEMDVPLRSLTEDRAFQALAAESEKLVEAAQQTAQGQWPEVVSTHWDRPTSRAWAVAASLAGLAIAGTGLYLTSRPSAQSWGQPLIAMGATLIPDTAGKFVKEAGALRAPAADAPGGASG